MDKTTHQVRRQQWAAIINECLASGMKKTQWCRENGVSEKRFFYWQRKLRDEAYQQMTALPAVVEKTEVIPAESPVFAELPQPQSFDSENKTFHPDIIIRSSSHVIEISNTASTELLSILGGILNAE